MGSFYPKKFLNFQVPAFTLVVNNLCTLSRFSYAAISVSTNETYYCLQAKNKISKPNELIGKSPQMFASNI